MRWTACGGAVRGDEGGARGVARYEPVREPLIEEEEEVPGRVQRSRRTAQVRLVH